MTKAITRIGDAVLSKLLGQETAGACVPEQGTYCGCKPAESYCATDGTAFRRYRKAYLNCYGTCKATGAVCGQVKIGVC